MRLLDRSGVQLRIFEKGLFPKHIILIGVAFIALLCMIEFNSAFGQVNETSQNQTYENDDLVIRLSYPSDWGNITAGRRTDCSKDPSCAVGIRPNSESLIGMAIGKYTEEECSCNSLKDFAKYVYKRTEKRTEFSFINDNTTTVGKKYPALQYESSSLNIDNIKVKSLEVMTTNNETYFELSFSYPIESGAKVLPEFRRAIDSLEFLPFQNNNSKKPSFMN